MRKAELDNRISLVLIAIALLFGLLAARLWHLQVIMGKQYTQVSHDNRLRTEKVPSPRGIIYDRNGKPLVKNAPYYFAALLPEMVRKADLLGLAEFLGMNPREVSDIVGAVKDPIDPIRIKGGMTFEEVAFIEARLSDYPGLVIEAEETRHYIYGPVGSHLIGYLGKLNPQQASKTSYRNVPKHSFTGQWGVEKMFDARLRGEPGNRVIEVDALGRKLRILSEQEPGMGEDLYLSIDMDLQEAAEEAFGTRAGALVAIRPDTGEVLALVSRPSFDPNLFSRGIGFDNWTLLREDKGFPLLNRALQSNYPPGSTFKIITALAALETGTMKTGDRHTCNGVLNKGRWSFRCRRRSGHGIVNMLQGIIESCDVYFYRTGELTGIDSIARYARLMGLGAESGLGLIKEKEGLVPDREWKQRTKGLPWYPGNTYNSAIGQGFVLVTPIQLAQMTATVANGGYHYPLSLVRAEELPLPAEDLHLDPENVEFLRKALREVVTNAKGTGQAANSRFVEIAGKTGTAQVVAQKTISESELPEHLKDHAWFVAFAPFEHPEIAMAVFVENGGHGGAAAAPIARKAIEAYLVKDQVAARKAWLERNAARRQAAPQPQEQKEPEAPRTWTDVLTAPQILNAVTPAGPREQAVPGADAPHEEAVEQAPAVNAPAPAAPMVNEPGAGRPEELPQDGGQ